MIRYDYCNWEGRLRYTVVREGDGQRKEFRVVGPRGGRRPNPLPAPDRLLYRLPELLAADPHETVHLCEGEKDVETLAAHGLTATTMPFGTRGGWLTQYNADLAGRHVVVLPDNDGPGRRHAEAVAGALDGCASLLLLPLGGGSGLDDVTTWCMRRSRPGPDLQRLVRRARYHRAGLPNRRLPTGRDCATLIRRAPLTTLQKLALLLCVEDVHYGSVREMARDCGVHRVTAQNSLRDLQRLGIVPAGGPPASREAVRWDLLAAMLPARAGKNQSGSAA